MSAIDSTAWEGRRVIVTGVGVSGFAAADTLLHLGAHVTVVDDSEGHAYADNVRLLELLGADLKLGEGSSRAVEREQLSAADLVVTSPGWNPRNELLASAAARGIDVWGEVELAWRLRGPNAAPWLAVTGTNGKTTTVQMLESILNAAQLRARAVGNVGVPVVQAVMDTDNPADVFAVELSSFQLHWTHTMAAEAAVVLNVAADHYDWHGGPDAYAADKARIYERVVKACVYNVADEATMRLVEEAEVTEGARAIGFTLGIPAPGEIGVVDGVIADRAFVPNRQTAAAELCRIDDLDSDAPHNVANALAAAALARAHGVEASAVRDGLRAFALGDHRIHQVADIDGVHFVNDSKATNPHAALASLGAVDSAVWIAGGLAKGATFDELVRQVAPSLRAVVLIGRDAPLIEDALQRHAPDVRVVTVAGGDTDFMDRVVDTAASLAQAGDTVLLAPACASMDQFENYAARGTAFADAVMRRARRA